jgi:YD repeat-containing protein
VIAIVDPLGQRTVYGYDLKNRKNTVTDALGKVTTTRYDAFGNVLSIIDPVNNQTSYEYSPKKIITGGGSLAISSDGRYVSLGIDSSLDSKDTNSLTDVFRLDRQTGAFIRVSSNPNGDAPNAYSYNTSISNDGRFLAFYSTITGLDGIPRSGLYLRDIENQTTSMIASLIGNSNQELNDYNKGFAISGDGQYIAFVSSESNIVSGDTNGVSDLFVKNIQTGDVERISISSNGDESNLGLDAFASIDISEDGRYVAFSSNATNLVDNDTNGVADVFVHDRFGGTTSRVSVSSSGNQANGKSYYHSISGNGRYVAFTSDAPSLSGSAGSFVFVHDLETGSTTQIAAGFAPSIDRDGRFLTFSSGNVLTAGDTPNANDVFLYDLASGALKILSSGIGGVFSKISEDGKTVAFASNDFTDVSVYDVITGLAKSVGDRFGESFPINRLSSEVNANGAMRKYTYDPIGNVTTITDRDGTIQAFTYDKLNRRTQEQWINAQGNVTRNIISTYNAAGELTAITDPDSTYRYTYDLDGRMLTNSNQDTPNVPTTIMSYSYDNVGNVLSMTDTINGNLGIETTREYDALNRLTVNAQGNKRVDYAYNAISQVTNKKRYSDITGTNLVVETNNIYDNLNRLTNITHSKGANIISSYAQTYDAGSKITGVTGTDGSSTYTYDDTNQLTGADYNFQADESYTYDSNGNRTNAGYVTGVNNRLLEDSKYRYEYDLVGNRTKRTDKLTGDMTDYGWDIRDRLTGWW